MTEGSDPDDAVTEYIWVSGNYTRRGPLLPLGTPAGVPPAVRIPAAPPCKAAPPPRSAPSGGAPSGESSGSAHDRLNKVLRQIDNLAKNEGLPPDVEAQLVRELEDCFGRAVRSHLAKRR